MKISELKPRSDVPEIEVQIVSKGEAREWANANGSGRVCSCAGKDETGEISISLWNEQIDQVEEGDIIKISDGWCSEFRGDKQLSTGRRGRLEVLK